MAQDRSSSGGGSQSSQDELSKAASIIGQKGGEHSHDNDPGRSGQQSSSSENE